MELKILNMEQVAFYILKGVQPKRIEVGKENKIVFIYSKEETSDLFGEWLKLSEKRRKLKKEYKEMREKYKNFI